MLPQACGYVPMRSRFALGDGAPLEQFIQLFLKGFLDLVFGELPLALSQMSAGYLDQCHSRPMPRGPPTPTPR